MFNILAQVREHADALLEIDERHEVAGLEHRKRGVNGLRPGMESRTGTPGLKEK